MSNGYVSYVHATPIVDTEITLVVDIHGGRSMQQESHVGLAVLVCRSLQLSMVHTQFGRWQWCLARHPVVTVFFDRAPVLAMNAEAALRP